MPARQDSYSVSVPNSPPPPQDLSSYSRFIHDYTKRQMEASGSPPPQKTDPRSKASGSMTNGISPTEYHS